MYEELLIGLRGHAKLRGCDTRCPCYDARDRGYVTCSEELAQKAAYAIEELQRRLEQALYMPLPHWVSVTERLPEEWKSVLTYQPYKNDREKPLIRVSWYTGAGIWRECERANTLELPVTHWMPLPSTAGLNET